MLESVDATYPGQSEEKKEDKPVKNDNEDVHGVATGNVVETGNTNVST